MVDWISTERKQWQKALAEAEARIAEVTKERDAYRNQRPEDFITPYENELLGDLELAKARATAAEAKLKIYEGPRHGSANAAIKALQEQLAQANETIARLERTITPVAVECMELTMERDRLRAALEEIVRTTNAGMYHHEIAREALGVVNK